MGQHGIGYNDGMAIMMEQPFPGSGGRHCGTWTYGNLADLGLSARDALAGGIRDARTIFRSDGVYSPTIHQGLSDLIQENKRRYPSVFNK